ncbi:F-box/LRR-repeat protein At4g14103-like [Chenopodium quinoa]|uniref:F-box/LRR-repeat protein At4g14103-like n=1 Tax=Chenopodium quinoa TaxID=63459 RepID=UPI000B783B08|nr:F-box/LRR-repeat protein At4g14103-like [Chenopodium quinoa]
MQCNTTYTTVWDVQNHNVSQVLVDRLTSLPDELLIRILSLLPTKDAAATSVLSRRLRRVFPLLTSLDLDISPISLCLEHPYAIERFPTFVSFVDTLLQAHQSQYLTKFRLHVNTADFDTTYFKYNGCTVIGCKQGCLPHLKSPGLYTWISYPLNLCGLRELDLRILVREPGDSQLPPAIFTCETLETLKLEVNLGLDQVFTMPSYRLPNLKLLLFSSLSLSEDGFLPRLVSSCPVLEDLTFKPCTNHVNITAITSTSLRRLCLIMIKWPDFQEDNSDFVLINTPNLELLEYRDNLAKCYSIPAMHCLVKAVLRIESLLKFEESVPMIEVMLSLVRPLSYAQHLSLCSFIVQEFDYVDEKVLKDQLPVFPNLTHLELGGGGTDNYWNKLLLPLLISQLFTCLRNTCFHRGTHYVLQCRTLYVSPQKSSDKGILWIRTGSRNDPVSPETCISFGGTGHMLITISNSKSDATCQPVLKRITSESKMVSLEGGGDADGGDMVELVVSVEGSFNGLLIAYFDDLAGTKHRLTKFVDLIDQLGLPQPELA